jgi:hypothetical protein
MYTTCLHCHGDLGRNESIELFPVGRRVAFDQAKGRLWVICTHCARWNLTPMEERWEVIEACERLYRERPERMTSGEIGVAKATEGLTLVRIGRPVFPEYASWRYGQRFAKRRTRHLVLSGGALAGGLAVVIGGPSVMAALFGIGGIGGVYALHVLTALNAIRAERRPLGSVPQPEAPPRLVRGREAHLARLISPRAGGFRIEIDGVVDKSAPGPRDRILTYEGDAARHFLRLALPIVNKEGATPRVVDDATHQLALHQGPVDPLSAAHRELLNKGHGFTLLRELPQTLRVGLEMAVYEDQERRWLLSELFLLKAAWQEAEKLAAISDALTIPVWLEEQMEKLKGRADADRPNV